MPDKADFDSKQKSRIEESLISIFFGESLTRHSSALLSRLGGVNAPARVRDTGQDTPRGSPSPPLRGEQRTGRAEVARPRPRAIFRLSDRPAQDTAPSR